MNIAERIFDNEDVDPIDIIESLAQQNDWDFDRITQDQIAMAIEGSWRTYALTLSWSEFDEMLKLICTFDLNAPENKISHIYEILNLANNKCWHGSFTFLCEDKLIVYRYGMELSGGAIASAVQLNNLVENAVFACERFYPAFQLTSWGDENPPEAMKIAFDQTYGRA